MKSIREIQYDTVRSLFQDLARFRSQTVTADILELMRDEIRFNTKRIPLAGNYRIEPYAVIDTNKLNTELGLIRADAETIFQFLMQYYEWIKDMKFATSVWGDYLKNRTRELTTMMSRYAAPVFIKGFTDIVDLIACADSQNSTLEITSDGMLSLSVSGSHPGTYHYTERDITITPIGSGLTAYVYGSPIDIVDLKKYGNVTMSLTGSGSHMQNSEAGFELRIDTDVTNINMISIDCNEYTVGAMLQVRISSNRTTYETVYHNVLTSSRIDIPVPVTDISRLYLRFTRSSPNITTGDTFKYEFTIKNLIFSYVMMQKTGVYQSIELPLDDDITSVAVVVDEECAGDTTVKYSVATTKNSEGAATGFFTIDPYAVGSVIPLDMRRASLFLEPRSRQWNIPGDKRHGARLYNIFDGCMNIAHDDFVIENGTLTMTNSSYIINEDSIKLYRGHRDYIAKSSYLELERYVAPLLHMPDAVASTAWVEPVLLRTTLRAIIEPDRIYDDGGIANKIKVEGKIENYEEIRVEREDGLYTRNIITNIEYDSGYTWITFAPGTGAVFDTRYHYFIHYVLTLQEYVRQTGVRITLDDTSFSIQIHGDIMTQGIDYIIDYDAYAIELIKSGKYYRYYIDTAPGINIAYSYVEVNSTASDFYETSLFVASTTVLTIFPFTSSEIAAGNFHRVDGDLISTAGSVTLSPGWHTVQTTHPHRSLNEYDVNSITGRSCQAGIIIPDTVDIMRPYRDSMRRVSEFVLMSIEADEGMKCFSFSGGKLFINFEPDSIDADMLALDNYSHIRGATILAKRPVIDSINYITTAYIAQPEQLHLEFSYSSGTGAKSIFLRVAVSAENSLSSVHIKQIGLNKYREDPNGVI